MSGRQVLPAGGRIDRVLAGVFWIWLYLLVVLTPLFTMFVAPVPSGRPFLLELGIAFGFVGLTQIAVQFALVARFRRITAPYGIDVILHYHRQIALIAVGFILLHVALIVIQFPARAELLNPFGGNHPSRLAWVGLVALLGLVVSSLYRRELRLSYEHWRVLHLVLAVTALLFTQLHVAMAGLYENQWWKYAVGIVIALLMVSIEVELRVLRPARQRRRPWKVVEVRPERGNSSSLVLEPDGHDGMAFAPGQFAWIKLGDSPFTLNEHPFSFSSSATNPTRLEFGVKAVGDFTRMLPEITAGTRAYLDGPHGAFTIDRYEAPGYIFIAGGIGVTPLLSCLRTMADRRDPRPVLLINAQKNWEGATFQEALAELAPRLDLEIVHVLSEPENDWQGERGFVGDALLDRLLPREMIERAFLICGPPPMLAAVSDALLRRGVPERRIVLERFDLV